MARNLWVSVLAAAAIAGAGVAMAAVPANLTAALGDKARPPADSSRDMARKPAELLAFGEVKPGQKVADFMMGGGYFTRILAAAVGPAGKVYAYQSAEFIQYRAAYAAEQSSVVADYKNVVPLTAPIASAGLPDGLDLVLTVQNYHDLHLKARPAKQGTNGKRRSHVYRRKIAGNPCEFDPGNGANGIPAGAKDTQSKRRQIFENEWEHPLDEIYVSLDVEEIVGN